MNFSPLINQHDKFSTASLEIEVPCCIHAPGRSHSPSIHELRDRFPSLRIDIDACYTINPYATRIFQEFTEELYNAPHNLHPLVGGYPSENNILASLVSERIGIDKHRILLGNGAIEVIQAVLQNFCGQKIVINLPGFSSYYDLLPARLEPVFNPLSKAREYQLDPEVLIQLVHAEQADSLVLVNPNNPDGGFLSPPQVEHLLKELRSLETIILDESFIHFAVRNSEAPSALSAALLCERYPNLIIIKSMSKDYGIPGIRAGYGIMTPERVAALRQTGFLWNISGWAEYFFRLFARDDFQHAYNTSHTHYIRDIISFGEQLAQIPGIRVLPSMANFYLVELLQGRTSAEVTQHLLFNGGIYVRDCSSKKGLEGEYLRISTRTKDENNRIISALRKALNT